MSKLRDLFRERIAESCTLQPYSHATRNFCESDATPHATASQQCAGNTHPDAVPHATTRATKAQPSSCTPSEKQASDATAVATTAIGMADLTDDQKAARLADLRRDPGIARFWALVWPEATNPTSKDST